MSNINSLICLMVYILKKMIIQRIKSFSQSLIHNILCIVNLLTFKIIILK